ncbi:hypothetical protein BASA50_002348 [Batrachochytrium salamandrivorans]|uniref:Uncharacterized protein n=1 Tax=Batrachochytrium salamandrivorans TaxID=1357716 RepID=A0ABQ8FLX4_9FUNG|nr:hypothetical protein BASA62_004780 [Batrachochytrium salamandrivorans]KAH6600337.1 hypothetical protein BASA50_002348 [Batrachochytrium salamandrivorans]
MVYNRSHPGQPYLSTLGIGGCAHLIPSTTTMTSYYDSNDDLGKMAQQRYSALESDMAAEITPATQDDGVAPTVTPIADIEMCL